MGWLFSVGFWVIFAIVFLLILFFAPFVAIVIVGGILVFSVSMAIVGVKMDEMEQKSRRR